MRAAGSKVLSVYVPRREEVFADRLPSAWPRTLAATKPAFVQALSQAGPVLDLTSTLADPSKRDSYFWRTDHHWTPAGALAGLAAISQRAATMGVDIPADNRTYVSHTYGTFFGSLGREVTSGGVSDPDQFAVPLPVTPRAHICSSGVCDQAHVRHRAGERIRPSTPPATAAFSAATSATSGSRTPARRPTARSC